MKSRKIFTNALVYLVVVSAVMVTGVFPQSDRPPQKEQLLNGLKVLMWPDNKAEKVWVRVRIHAGSAFDPQGKEGVMQLLSDNLFPGPTTSEFFADDLGGSLEVVTTYDYIQIDASVKPDSLLTALETLSTALVNPPIDKATSTNLRNVLLAKVNDLQADPAYVADRAVSKRLLGTFPYGRPQLGTPESLQKIDFADLLEAKQRLLTADNATVAISGNFDRPLTFRAVRRYFGAWLKADKKVPSTFRQADDPPPGVLTIPAEKGTTPAVRVAIRGSARGDKDFASSAVFASVVENRLKARVSPQIAAGLFVQSAAYVLPGQLVIGFASTDPFTGAKKDEDIVRKALTDPITDSELSAAKSAVGTVWSRRTIEDLWLDLDTYKLADVSADRRALDRVTVDDVNLYATKLRQAPRAYVIVNIPSQ